MTLVADAYRYRLRDLLVGTRAEKGLIQYQNNGKIHATGFEMELNGQPLRWLEATASYAIQRSVDDIERNALENSPDHLAKLRFAVPLGRKFEFSSGMQYYSSRMTLAEAAVGSVYLADFTLTCQRLLPNFDAQFEMIDRRVRVARPLSRCILGGVQVSEDDVDHLVHHG